MSNPFERDWTTDVNVKVDVSVKTPKEEPKKKGYTDITIVMDRSSSMISMREAVVDSLNKQFSRMRETPGDTRWSLVNFDDPDSAKGGKEAFPQVVFEHRAEKDMRPMKLEDFQPRGTTALVDAVCKTIRQVDSRTSGQTDRIKPVVMIITDGQENSSREFTSAQMREMIAEKQKAGMEFMFLAANQDAWTEAGKYGMDKVYNSHAYDYAGGSVASGAVASGSLSLNSFNFVATSRGISEAIASGCAGVYHMASGYAAKG